MSESNCRKSENILRSQTYTDEDEYSEGERRALRKDRAWEPIWSGGLMQCHLTIRCQVAEDNGHLVYNGHRLNRRSWSWRPPRIIRMQGRTAREPIDAWNDRPEISIVTASGAIIRLDACPCGGKLLRDLRGFIYCEKCKLIYE